MYLFSLPLVGYLIVGANYFLAIGRVVESMVLNLTRQFLVLVPLILILPHFLQIDGIWLFGPISDASALLLTTVLLVKEWKKISANQEDSLTNDEIMITENSSV